MRRGVVSIGGGGRRAAGTGGVPGLPYPGWVSRGSDPVGNDATENEPGGNQPAESDAGDTDRPPTQIRVAGALTTFEGAIALIVAVILVIRGLTEDRHDAFNGIGTALWLAIIFGGVFAGGLALLSGRRWGRAISVVAQLLLLPVSYYLYTSHQPLWAVPLALLALVTLGFLFTPTSLNWIAGDLELDDEPDETHAPRRATGPARSNRSRPRRGGR